MPAAQPERHWTWSSKNYLTIKAKIYHKTNGTEENPEVYPVPAGEYFGRESESIQIAYAPLYGAYTLVTSEEASELQATDLSASVLR